jgi:YegS/Rv2252/BmrU family lipid kinase
MAYSERALLLINPESRLGRERDISPGLDVLRRSGCDADVVYLDGEESGTDIIGARGTDYDLLIIGGGDGTLNTLAEAVVDSGLPLGILPLGTGNDLARTLAIPFGVEEACRVIAAGRRKKIDLGRVNGKFFFNVASMGFSSGVVRQLDPLAKKRWGSLAYLHAFYRALRRKVGKRRTFKAKIVTSTRTLRFKSIQIGVGNGRYYGGGLVVAEDAAIDNHELVLYSIKPAGVVELLRMVPGFITGRHVDLERVVRLRDTNFKIYTRRTMSIDTDGELTRRTPGYFDIVPGALEVFVPGRPR